MSEKMKGDHIPLLGIDWGTTNRRAYLLDQAGRLVKQQSDEFGILAVGGDFEGSLARLLNEFELDHAEVIMSGMVGSLNGWQQVPYLSIAQPLARLPESLAELRTSLPNVRCRIVPGYRYDDAQGTPDVMRGEETQVFGALLLSASDGWFLHPGTHSKWIHIREGAITEFSTFMTGELFALLTRYGTLAALMQQREPAADAFEEGLRAATRGSLSHAAFGCRALVVTDSMPASHAWSYLSGLLSGSEVQDIQQRNAGNRAAPVQIIGSPELEAHYQKALKFFGMSAAVWQPDEVYLAALRALAGIDPLIMHNAVSH